MELTALLEFLGTVLGTTPGALQQALIADDKLKPKSEIKAFLSPLFQQKLDAAERAGKEEGKGWGERESKSEIEKWIQETFQVEPSGDVKAQIQALHQNATKSSKLTEDDVKNSEVFQSEISKFQNEIKTRDGKIKELEESNRREKITSVLKQNAASILKDKNFIIPEEKEVASNLQKLYIQSLWKEGVDFKVDEDGSITPTDEKGNPLKDNLHNPIGFGEYAQGVAKLFFPQREGSGKETPGNTTDSGKGGDGTKTNFNFKNREEAMKRYNSETDAEKKSAILEAMRAFSGSNEAA